jgi:hypothetical protein
MSPTANHALWVPFEVDAGPRTLAEAVDGVVELLVALGVGERVARAAVGRQQPEAVGLEDDDGAAGADPAGEAIDPRLVAAVVSAPPAERPPQSRPGTL